MRNGHKDQLIGDSLPMVELREEIERTARSDAKVLITGESGVGKELVAAAVHAKSMRTSRPFVALNCAGLPETLLESELFGHVKGSFTGAYRDKRGKLELADHGTMFLDEIGEMPLRMQGLLLRFLETGEIQKVGTDRAIGIVDVRIIAATNRNLSDMIAAGTFREDLFYRLNVIHLCVPALRERREDIPLLVRHFLGRFGANGNGAPDLSPETLTFLTQYSWPGNVRELENAIERMVITSRKALIEVNDLPAEIRTQVRVAVRPRRERRRTPADDLYQQLIEGHQSFWSAVYPLFVNREITKTTVRDVVRRGLAETRGNYKLVARLFNLPPEDYKRFLNFLRKNDCQIPFREYR